MSDIWEDKKKECKSQIATLREEIESREHIIKIYEEFLDFIESEKNGEKK